MQAGKLMQNLIPFTAARVIAHISVCNAEVNRLFFYFLCVTHYALALSSNPSGSHVPRSYSRYFKQCIERKCERSTKGDIFLGYCWHDPDDKGNKHLLNIGQLL
jgi:hypothetical protein